MATIAPAIDWGATVSNSMAWLCAESDDAALCGWLEEVDGALPLLLQPTQIHAMRNVTIKSEWLNLRLNILSILSEAHLLLEIRRGRELKVKQRHFVIKNCLVKIGERFSPRSDSIEQLDRRAFTGL